MRVVSLLPSATEILFAIGAGDRVVGVTHECDYPQAASKLPQLTASSLPVAGSPGEIDRHVRKSLHEGSSLYHLDSGLLEQLAPDVIITQELCKVCAVSYDIVAQAAKRLRSDPRVLSLEPTSLEDVYANIGTVAEIVGAQMGAERLVLELQAREAALRERYEHHAHPRTLVLEWTDPPMSAGHWTPGLVEIAGGMPVLSNPGENSKVLDWGDILAEAPDVVIVAPCGYDLEKTNKAIAELEEQPEFRRLRAHREHRVHAVDGNAYVNRPGPRLLDSAEIFAACIHET